MKTLRVRERSRRDRGGGDAVAACRCAGRRANAGRLVSAIMPRRSGQGRPADRDLPDAGTAIGTRPRSTISTGAPAAFPITTGVSSAAPMAAASIWAATAAAIAGTRAGRPIATGGTMTGGATATGGTRTGERDATGGTAVRGTTGSGAATAAATEPYGPGPARDPGGRW